MVQIKNNQTIKEIISGANIQTHEEYPIELGKTVVPTMEVNPKMVASCNIARSSGNVTTTGTITGVYTTPTDKDFYLCSLDCIAVEGVTCDVATGSLSVQVIVGGKSINLITLPVLTLTSSLLTKTISYAIPIKIDRGTAIVMTGTFTAGALSRSFSLTGYEL
jgi:hypothetical protein